MYIANQSLRCHSRVGGNPGINCRKATSSELDSRLRGNDGKKRAHGRKFSHQSFVGKLRTAPHFPHSPLPVHCHPPDALLKTAN
jgi:hypothetical protein